MGLLLPAGVKARAAEAGAPPGCGEVGTTAPRGSRHRPAVGRTKASKGRATWRRAGDGREGLGQSRARPRGEIPRLQLRVCALGAKLGGVGGAGDAVVGCRVVPTAWGWCVVFAARSSSPSAPQILPCTPVSDGLLAGCSVCAHGAAGRAGCLPGVRGDLQWPGVTRGHPCSTQEDIWDLTVTRCVGATPHLGRALRGGLRGFHLGGAAWPPPFPPGRRAAGEGRGILPACPHLRKHQPGSARFWGTALHPLPAAQAGTEPPVISRLG